MKVCPNCDSTFTDDTLSYCLHDGSPLLSSESEPTVVIERSESTIRHAAPIKKRKTGLWIGLGVVFFIFAIVVVAAAILFVYNRKPETTNIKLPGGINAAPTPKAGSPKPSPPAKVSPSPSTNVEPGNDDTKTEDADEVTPISWSTSGSTFKTDAGQTYKFECPENGEPAVIWGSDIYTADSSICTAAVHAGIITLKGGGNVTIEFRPGRSTYGSTIRNGITSNTYGEFPHSFVVK